VRDTCQKFGWKLYICEPKKGETMEDFVRKFGFPHQGIHNAIMSFLKYHPWRKFNRDNGRNLTYFSGRRKKESKRRSKIVKTQIDKIDGMTFNAEIWDWKDQDVWNYIKKNELDLCPVYETLHMS